MVDPPDPTSSKDAPSSKPPLEATFFSVPPAAWTGEQLPKEPGRPGPAPASDQTHGAVSAPSAEATHSDSAHPADQLAPTLAPPPWGGPRFPAQRRAAQQSATPLPKVPGYEILAELGRGGMGVVYKARQVGLNRIVALKTILAAGYAGKDGLERFRREARVIAELQHPNIVQIYDVGEADEQPYFSLEFVAGGSLADRLDGSPWPPRQAAQLLIKLAEAIDAAHQRSIVHRDLKPANILLSAERGTRSAERADKDESLRAPNSEFHAPKITDFGLAKKMDSSAGQTHSGAILGTPSYMAPEQAEGRSHLIGPATDIYALGAILYELLTGRPPFRGETAIDTLYLLCKQEPLPPSSLQPKVPRDLETICLKCLRKPPPQRYASGRELAEDLQRFLDGAPIRARPVSAAERSLKFLRRHPAAVGLAGAVVLCTLIGIGAGLSGYGAIASTALIFPISVAGAVGVYWQYRKSEVERQGADEQRQQAEAARREVEQQVQKTTEALAVAESNLYFLQIALAERELLAANVARARDLLDACPRSGRNWEWHYLDRQCHAELTTFEGHTRPPLAVAFRPDGKQYASGGWDGQVVLVEEDDRGRQMVRELAGHTAQITCLAYTPDGRRLASASGDCTVIVWNPVSGEQVHVLRDHPLSVLALAFSPDGRQLATACVDQVVRTFNGPNQRPNLQLRGHTKPITAVAFSPDGERLASAGADEVVRIWELEQGQEALTLRGHKGPIHSIAFSPDGRRLASAGEDRMVRIWDATTGRPLATCWGHGGPVLAVAFQPGGTGLASASWDWTVKIWDPDTAEELTTFRGHAGIVSSLAYRPDGKVLASASQDLTVKLWDATRGPEAQVLLGHQRDILGVAFSANGRLLVSGGGRQVGDDTGEIKIWDLAVSEELVAMPAPPRTVRCVAFHPEGPVIATGLQDGSVIVWSVASGQPQRTIAAHAGAVSSIAYSPDGRCLASAGEDGNAHIWRADSGEEVSRLKIDVPLAGVAYSADGSRVALLSKDRITARSEVNLGNPVKGMVVPPAFRDLPPAAALAYSPDNTLVLSGHDDGTIRVHDMASGRTVATLRGHTDIVASLAFSPDGHRLASASHDRTVRLWDTETGEVILTLRGHRGEVTSVAFSPDGQRLVSAGCDQAIRIWDASPLAVERVEPVASGGAKSGSHTVVER